jgi:3-phenylpropionate/trans-cinnamate dioxygenase ferredoxin component
VSAPAQSAERVASLQDLDEALPAAAQLADGTRLCLVRNGAEVFAFIDRCPHRDFALSGGDVVAPCVIECPWHGAQFDVRTGNVVRGPATDPLQRLAVRIEGDDVYVAGERT